MTAAATIAGTTLALLAFAANSLLCRAALANPTLDAASFTAIRLASGALMLAVLVRARHGNLAALRWRGFAAPLALFLYALPFSLAYVRIGAATGALVLFGAVQLTLLGVAVARGERPRLLAWGGFAIAIYGLLWLVGPSAQRPDLLGVALMTGAGAAWAAYTLIGRRSGEPLAANANAFLWSSLFAAVPLLLSTSTIAVTAHGALLASLSGAVASALGYAVWYRVLPRLHVTTAAFAQLTVPAIAALGAVLLLGESLTLRTGLATTAVLGGVAIALAARQRTRG